MPGATSPAGPRWGSRAPHKHGRQEQDEKITQNPNLRGRSQHHTGRGGSGFELFSCPVDRAHERGEGEGGEYKRKRSERDGVSGHPHQNPQNCNKVNRAQHRHDKQPRLRRQGFSSPLDEQNDWRRHRQTKKRPVKHIHDSVNELEDPVLLESAPLHGEKVHVAIVGIVPMPKHQELRSEIPLQISDGLLPKRLFRASVSMRVVVPDMTLALNVETSGNQRVAQVQHHFGSTHVVFEGRCWCGGARFLGRPPQNSRLGLRR